VATIAEGTLDVVRNFDVPLILAAHEQRRVDLAKNFVQRQFDLDLIAVAAR
jgi:hypothetical protein